MTLFFSLLNAEIPLLRHRPRQTLFIYPSGLCSRSSRRRLTIKSLIFFGLSFPGLTINCISC